MLVCFCCRFLTKWRILKNVIYVIPFILKMFPSYVCRSVVPSSIYQLHEKICSSKPQPPPWRYKAWSNSHFQNRCCSNCILKMVFCEHKREFFLVDRLFLPRKYSACKAAWHNTTYHYFICWTPVLNISWKWQLFYLFIYLFLTVYLFMYEYKLIEHDYYSITICPSAKHPHPSLLLLYTCKILLIRATFSEILSLSTFDIFHATKVSMCSCLSNSIGHVVVLSLTKSLTSCITLRRITCF